MIVYLDQLRLKVAYQIAKVLAKTKITPNQITILRFIIAAPVSAYLFSRGEYLYNLLGLIFYVPLAIIDWVDGSLARLTGQSSSLGKFLDITFDRVLMLVVLLSIFYAGIVSSGDEKWGILTILFFSVYLFLTASLSDFDQLFNLEFNRYPEVIEKIYQLDENPKLIDRLLINFLDVHRNSITRFCFCISYPLFVGIITNQLLLTFVFITFMFGLRVGGVLFIIYRVVRRGRTDSTLTKVLRKYMVKK